MIGGVNRKLLTIKIMSFQVGTVIGECNQELSIIGQRVSQADLMLYFSRSLDYLNTGYKLPTTERVSDLLVFPGIFEYPVPVDFLGSIGPQRPYDIDFSPDFDQERVKDFVHNKTNYITGYKFSQDNQFLLVNDETNQKIIISNCDSLTGEGTWVVGGDGSNLQLDQQIYIEGMGSLRFTITPNTGLTTLTNTAVNQQDLTDLINSAYAFINLQCPSSNTAAISSVEIRIGTDASNYYSITSTTRYRGDNIVSGWAPIGANLSTATTVGSPTITNAVYVQIRISNGVTSATAGLYRLDNIFLANPVYYQLPYYSKYNIKNSSGVYQQTITSTDDTVLIPGEFSTAVVYKTLELAAVEKLRDADLANYFARELKPKEAWLRAKFPSQEVRTQTNWYKRSKTF